jgi:ABC-type Fe3+/spermidine/putrescine transport system ATPase subunit
MNTLIEIEGLAKLHGATTVFSDVSFTLAKGDRLAVLGASGGGKTTLVRLLAGLDMPSRGRIARVPGIRTAMVFQDLALWPNLTACDNVAFALPGLPRAERHERALVALAACRVAELSGRKPGSLSVGQQQRVALARAIAARPHLLLLDEPFSNLDLLLKQELMAEVARTADELGAAVVLVTHDPLEALSLARRALVLEDGRLAEAGELRALLQNPRSRLLQAFAGQIGGLAATQSAPVN